jgi:hypothetical protein
MLHAGHLSHSVEIPVRDMMSWHIELLCACLRASNKALDDLLHLGLSMRRHFVVQLGPWHRPCLSRSGSRVS